MNRHTSDTRLLTATHAEAEPLHTEEALQPHLQAPAAQATWVSHTRCGAGQQGDLAWPTSAKRSKQLENTIANCKIQAYDAPPGEALQGQSPLMRLPRIAACLCCGGAELLKRMFGFAFKPAAHCYCTGLKQAASLQTTGGVVGACLLLELARCPHTRAGNEGVAQVSPKSSKYKLKEQRRALKVLCVCSCCR